MEKILLIDDDEGLTHFLCRFFKRKGYDVVACSDGRSALRQTQRDEFDLIMLDYKIPDINGLDVLNQLKEARVRAPIVLMTAYGSTDTAIEAMKRGAYDYLNKPFERDELSRIVGEALELNRQMKEVVCLPHAETTATAASALKIIGQGRKMQAVYKIIGQIAEKEVPVLIGGESGTGKELVAKAIYHHSRRKHDPFIAINCAAIPEQLFESELFGFERGAFTGADRARIGKIERADGGTCFLDEIGELSMAMQAKLLRILQEGELERIGGRQTLKVDARILAATNKDLAEEVQRGRFREDLFWRLKVITIDLPPLRRRIEDIPDLMNYFVQRFSEEYGKPIRHVADGVLRAFEAYSWPGNVREMENCIRRAILLCTGDIIAEEHVGLLDGRSEHRSQTANREHLLGQLKDKLEELVPEIIRLSDHGIHANIIETVEETIILKALEACGNNQVKAAKILGVSRNTLRHRLKKRNEKLQKSSIDEA